MTTPKWTPGPWRWEVNLKSRDAKLCGGRPKYDATVLDAVRWGMSGAGFRFNVDGLMTRVDGLAVLQPGREHHREWFQLVAHPDARLIAAAPMLYAALEALLTHDSAAGPCDVPGLKCDCYERARAALKRARGE